jgi:phytoene synthase
MAALTPTWESKLLALAYAGLESRPLADPIVADKDRLAQAYALCATVAQEHSRTFYLASGLLPADKCRAARALYAFCRISDDLVDRAEDLPVRLGQTVMDLALWRQCALAIPPPCDDLVALAWADTRLRYRIPSRYAEQLVDGVDRDQTVHRYATFDDLAVYCYGVASTVGLMAMHIIGFAGLSAIPYAVKLGAALQLTNILRDVGEDWRAGRLYLPQDELARFGLSEDDVAASRVDDRWRAFLRFQIARAHQLYAESLPGIALLDPDGRFAIGAAAELYQAILGDIEAHDYDVFHRRAHVGTWGKLRRLPGIWWRAKRARYEG